MANWLSGYTTRKKITIDKSKIDSTLTDFPVLVKLTSSNFDFSKANSDGYDIRFTSADGTTLLKYERERHDSTNKLAEYWVKIPSISSTANTIFYLYYRVEDTDDGADPTNVWDSKFKGVWHMKDLTTSTIEDSTSNNNDGTKKAANEPIEADGKIARAQSFDGNNDYISVPENNVLDPTIITIEAWVKISSAPTNNGNIVEKGENKGYRFRINNDQTVSWFDRGGAVNHLKTTTKVSLNSWTYIVVMGDSSGLKIYLNGVLDKSGGSAYGGPNTSSPLCIGACKEFNEYFNGLIDEVRISSVARSSAWIKASYYSGNNSLVSYGNEEGIDNAVFFGCNF